MVTARQQKYLRRFCSSLVLDHMVDVTHCKLVPQPLDLLCTHINVNKVKNICYKN